MLCILAAAALLIGAAARPPHAEAALKSIWGPATLPDGSSAFPLYRRLGVDVYQENLQWAEVARSRPQDPRNPNDPAYLWPKVFDQVVADAQANGVAVAFEILTTPPWANGGRDKTWAPLSDADYADFAVAASKRYPTVRHWMIWGEPSRRDSFQPMPKDRREGPERYARLLDAAYAALKAENPANIVIGGMTFTSGSVLPRDFVKWMRLPSGLPPRLDWFGHNPFSRRFPRLSDPISEFRPGVRDLSDMDDFSREVRDAYRPIGLRPKLWLSEFTIQTDQYSHVFRFYTTHKGQAQWLAAAYRIADSKPYIAGLGWVKLLDEPAGKEAAHWGILTAAVRRKRSYSAFYHAPSRRLAPGVVSPSAASVDQLRAGVPITVRPKASGRITVTLAPAGKPALERVVRSGRSGVGQVITVRAAAAAPGSHTISVRASRGERIVRALSVR